MDLQSLILQAMSLARAEQDKAFTMGAETLDVGLGETYRHLATALGVLLGGDADTGQDAHLEWVDQRSDV